MKKTTIIAALAVALAGVSINSYAAPATATLSVSAEIAANCTISTTAVAFSGYDPIVTNKSNPLTSTGKVTTTCTNGSAVTVTLGEGANADTATSTPDVPVRQLASGANRLAYFLYSDSGTTVWGNTAGTGKADTGNGAPKDLTVYGSMPANQNKPVGSYTDTVLATVTF